MYVLYIGLMYALPEWPAATEEFMLIISKCRCSIDHCSWLPFMLAPLILSTKVCACMCMSTDITHACLCLPH